MDQNTKQVWIPKYTLSESFQWIQYLFKLLPWSGSVLQDISEWYDIFFMVQETHEKFFK